MTYPGNMGIIGGYPPSAFLAGGMAPTTVVSDGVVGSQTVTTYVVPLGVTRIAAEVWSGGAGAADPGGGNVRASASGGYAYASFAVQPGETLTLTIGKGGAAGNNAGGDSSVTRQTGDIVVKATGAGTSAGGQGTVGDVLMNGSDAGTPTAASADEFVQRTAPRAQGPIIYTIGGGIAGVIPGAGGSAIGGAGSPTAGGPGRIVLYVPNPVVVAV